MCGITGVYNLNKEANVSEEVVKKMRDTLVHRGPNNEGIYISSDKKIGLGFRRLAIIDLSSAGNQPMSNKEKIKS